MLLPMSPTDSMFLLGESRDQPMHVGGLALFEPPDGADAATVLAMLDAALTRGDVAPGMTFLHLEHPAHYVTAQRSTVVCSGKAKGHMNSASTAREERPDELRTSRFRSTSTIALGSALPGAAPALVLTGSFALCALVAVLVSACVGIAAHMI